jgi:hypothetical protein
MGQYDEKELCIAAGRSHTPHHLLAILRKPFLVGETVGLGNFIYIPG